MSRPRAFSEKLGTGFLQKNTTKQDAGEISGKLDTDFPEKFRKDKELEHQERYDNHDQCSRSINCVTQNKGHSGLGSRATRIAMAPAGHRPRRALWAPCVMLSPAYLWLVITIFLPLTAMVFFSLMSDIPLGKREWVWTLEHYRAFFSSSLYSILLLESLRLGLIVTGFSVLIGFPAALVLAKTIKGRLREAIFLLVILPFWSNGLVRVFSWSMVLREGGLIDRGLNALFPFHISFDILHSYPAMIVGLVHSYLPYMILTCYVSLQAIDDRLIEAARSLGAKRHHLLTKLIIPLSLPGLMAGSVLIFVPVIGSFMEPRLLGGRDGMLYGTVIEDQFVAVFNWPLGAALSFILLAVVVIILAAFMPIIRRVHG